MARISTYAVDSTPVSSDKVIGTDSAGVTTKNYPLGSVADWLKSSGATGIIGQNNYNFQVSADSNAGRLNGTISFKDYGGAGSNFSDITTIMVSGQSSAGQYVVDYITSIVGSKITLGQLDDLNSFGVYRLTAFTQDASEPTFYNASLNFVEGNGTLSISKGYGIATYSAVQGGATGPFDSIGLISENGSVFDVVVSNAGNLVVIPEGSTDPVITSPPVITGIAKVWYTLGAIAGGVTGSPTPITTWQWQRSAIGNVWIDIPGADAATYTLVSADANQFIRVQQKATNILDSVTASSTATASIEESIFNNTQWQIIAPVTWGQLTVQTWN